MPLSSEPGIGNRGSSRNWIDGFGNVQKLVESCGDCDSGIWTADGFEPLTEAGTTR